MLLSYRLSFTQCYKFFAEYDSKEKHFYAESYFAINFKGSSQHTVNGRTVLMEFLHYIIFIVR